MTPPIRGFLVAAILLAGCGLAPGMSLPSPTGTSVASPSAIPPTASPTWTTTPTHLPTPTPTPLPLEVVEFYRLRFALTSTSPWAEVFLGVTDRILASNVISVDGNPGTATITYASGDLVIHLNRVEDQMWAQSPQQIGITVDIALSPGELDVPLRVREDKGAWFSTSLSVFHLDGDQSQLLRTVRQVDEHGSFYLDLTSLASLPPSRAEVRQLAPPKMLWAVFYPWIGWDLDAACTDTPLLGYALDDPDVLAAHIQQAQEAGIDGFLVSWLNDADLNRRLSMLLDAAEETGFKIAIYLETTPDPTDRTLRPAQVQAWIAYALQAFGDHPAYMRLDGRPLVFVYNSTAAPRTTWQTMFDALNARGLAGFYFAMSYDPSDLEAFDGLHQYGVFGDPDLAATYQSVARSVRYFSLLSDSPRLGVWAATVHPGFDDCPYSPASRYVVDREDGAYYRSTFLAAISGDPDWIIITSWNEFGENTHIAPSIRYGDEYLRITAELADQWRSGQSDDE